MKLHLPLSVWPALLACVLCATAADAVPVSRLEVRVVTGAQALSAGSDLELRIYEAGKGVRRLPLVHGESWLPDSTHIIPVKLNDTLDPRNVVRFALYYRAGSPLAPAWEVVSADVEIASGKEAPARLLDATLSGVISKQGELASVERDQNSLACNTDADCDDHRACNGKERCAPHTRGADARGCVKGTPVVCPVNQVCGEGVGCHGTSALKTFTPDPERRETVTELRGDIDLRSDTVTRPSPGMRAAMAAAEVGDDVFGDDPSVNRLQAVAAERFGFESALFFPTGTQSNLAALMAHCGRGDEFLVGQEAHTYKYEQGGAAVLGSIQPQPLEHEPHGGISIERIAAAIKSDDYHFARTRLLALENTIGGRVLPTEYLREATAFAHSRRLATHLDGARIFNVIVKLDIDERSAVAGFDSVSMCLSKGLGAPAGSVLMGAAPLIADARRWRKALGGGMRQAGVLAAAGLYALEHNVQRLAEDHANAEYLAAGLRAAGFEVSAPQTNVVYLEVPTAQAAQLKAHLRTRGILANVAPRTRLVTHMDLPREKIETALRAFHDFADQVH